MSKFRLCKPQIGPDVKIIMLFKNQYLIRKEIISIVQFGLFYKRKQNCSMLLHDICSCMFLGVVPTTLLMTRYLIKHTIHYYFFLFYYYFWLE